MKRHYMLFLSTIISCTSVGHRSFDHRLPTNSGLVQILPFGDSNTYGYTPGGYRIHLSRLLEDRGIQFQFVGNEADLRDPKFMNHFHEGHIGWGLDDLAQGREGVSALASLSKFQPDVILFMAGTNDLGWKKHSVPQAEQDFRLLLDKLRQLSPNSWIVVATLLPFVDIKSSPPVLTPDNKLIAEFNSWLIAEVRRRAKTDLKLSLVDIAKNFRLENSIDGIHANDKGYAEMAKIWNEGLNFLGSDLATQSFHQIQPSPSFNKINDGEAGAF